MLERIEVDGFRSLNKFSLEVRPGLNILAGPNGSGKSNIVLFFEFLSHLSNGSVMQAISRIGGAGAVFTHLGDGKLAPDISFSLKGVGDYRTRTRLNQKKPITRTMQYEYRATIRLELELATLSFFGQQLKLFETDPQQHVMDFSERIPALSIDWRAAEKGLPVAEVTATDPSIFNPIYYRDADNTQINMEEFIARSFIDELPDYSLIQLLLRVVEPIRVIHDDLVEGRAYNIDPNMVRQLEDIASEPGIRYDGGGLAATLFASKKTSERLSSRSHLRQGAPFEHEHSTDLINVVSRYAQLINENIVRVDVDSNPFENKLRVWLMQKGGKGGKREIKMPISLASDGTVKWLALTTAVISSTSAFAIEEPENFLHPHMQTEIINMVRERAQKRRRRMFALITTHSETLLNAADPDEVIIVSIVDGHTRAARPDNVDDLRKEISQTGFGLGVFYVAGAIE